MPVAPYSQPDFHATKGRVLPPALAGRAEAIRSVLEAVEGTSGAVIVGREGIGKTALVNFVAASVSDRFHIVRVRGSYVSARSNYGALGWLLSDLPDEVLDKPVRVLVELKSHLKEQAGGRPILLIVDNAHQLDPLSQTVTAQLARQRAITLLTTTPDVLLCGEELMRLWSDGVLRRTDLGPLADPDARRLMETVAGGRLSALAARRVWTDTLGNPLFTSLLCRDQITAGRIQHRDGTWTLTGPLTYTGEISDWMKNWYRSLPAGERRVVELVSLCPGIPMCTLLAVSEPDAVDALEEREVLRVGPTDTAVFLRERLYAKLVATLVPVGRSFDLWHDILDAGPDLSRFPDTAVTAYAVWSAANGAGVAPELARRACAAATASGDPDAALRISAAVPGFRKHPAVLLERGRALAAMTRLREAETELQAVVRLGDPATTVAAHIELALAQCALLVPAEEPETSLSAAETAAGELPEDCTAEARVGTVVVRAVLAVRNADPDMLPPELPGLWQDTSLPEETRLIAGAVHAQALAIAGQGDAAAEVAGNVWNRLQAAQYLPDLHGGDIITGTFSAFIQSGDYRTALEVIAGAPGLRYLDAHLGSWAELPAGTVHALCGRADVALEYLIPAIRQLEIDDPGDLLPLAFAAAAYCYAVKRDWNRMREALVSAPVFRNRPAAMVQAVARYFRAAAALEHTPGPEAAEPLLLQGKEAQTRGCFPEAALCFAAAALAGSAEAVRLLAAASARASGPAAEAYQRLAAGLRDQDGSLLLEAAQRAVRLGNHGLGHKAARAAAEAASASMDRDLVRRSRLTANECFRFLAEAHSIGHSLRTLSDFERDLALRAAGGESSIRLGEALHLSSRTVDWHLGRIFQKLHVSGRSELRRLLKGQELRAVTGEEEKPDR